MGDRGQVLIEDEGVYLYTHWEAGSLIEMVKRAIAKGWRWHDPEYLVRIIFCEMIKGNEKGESGFGIGTQLHSDNNCQLIKVNCEKQTICIDGVYEGSFEDFIAS